jgi:hypothetical protein
VPFLGRLRYPPHLSKMRTGPHGTPSRGSVRQSRHRRRWPAPEAGRVERSRLPIDSSGRPGGDGNLDLDQRRRWDRFARDFAELLKRLESGTFPNREDWTLVLKIGTIAEELGRPRPIRMEVERERTGPMRDEGIMYGPIRERLVLRSFGPNPKAPSIGPIVGVEISRDEPTTYPVRGLPLRESAFHFVQRGDEPPAEMLFTWDRELRDVATFLAATWLPTIELARPIELSGKAKRVVELLAKRPDGMLGRELAKALRCEEKNLGRTVAEAIEKGLVENPRDGYGYRLTVLGRAVADEHVATDPEGSEKVREGLVRVRDGKSKAR